MKEAKMDELFFDKISKYDRSSEPVTVSFPFAEGRLKDERMLLIKDKERILPIQTRVLSRWKDKSIKWLLVHFQTDLPGNASKKLSFEITDSPAQLPAPFNRVKVEESKKGLILDTGVLSFLVSKEGFYPIRQIKLRGKRLWNEEPFSGFKLSCAGRQLCSAPSPVELIIEESGPLQAVVLIKGKHLSSSGEEFLDFQGRITAYAGKPYLEVEHWFFHREKEKELQLKELLLDFRPPASDVKAGLALTEGHSFRKIEESDERLEKAISAETLLYWSNEHFEDCFYGDFLVDWRNESTGLALSIYQAHQNFPKKLRVTQKGIACFLFPDDAPPATIYQGMSKSHRIMLHFHDGTLPLEEISARSLQFQLPDQPTLPKEWYRENNPWGMDYFPEKIPDRLLVRLSRMLQGRPMGLGMFHFGDSPDAGYTNQGRGQGKSVWVNNEYDRAHACTLFYALTGQRRALDSALVSARHWIEVDFCHKGDDPLREGGLIVHSAHHVTQEVTPSHEWVDGLLDYYHLTGRREGLEAALSVAENIIRHLKEPYMREPGATQAREGGWALRALVAMARETYQERFFSEAKRVAELLVSWQKEFGAMLAPYTNHSMVRSVFMISIAVNSLARYLLINEDKRVKKLIVETMDDLLENCIGLGGVFYYKELPSLKQPEPDHNSLESLTYAYCLSKDERYLKVALRQFADMFDGVGESHGLALDEGALQKKRIEDDAVIRGEGNGRAFAMYYIPVIVFAAVAGKEGLLDRFEYP